MNKEELRTYLGNPDWSELDRDLEACGISKDKSEYSDRERKLLAHYREAIAHNGEFLARYQSALFSNPKTPPQEVLEELLLLLEVKGLEKKAPMGECFRGEKDDEDTIPPDSQVTIKKLGKNKKKALSLFELFKEGEKKTGFPITLSRGIKLLAQSALEEKAEYSHQECERFLEACVRKDEALPPDGVESNDPSWGSLHHQILDSALSMGLEQAEQIKAILPQIVIKRLKEMATNGEMRTSFEKAWSEAGLRLGKTEEIMAQIDSNWEDYKLRASQPRQILPSSSTESSSKD